MINPINLGNVKTSIFYINDFHGKAQNMERAVNAAYEFETQNKIKSDADTFVLSSGDIAIGESVPSNKISVMFQNVIGVDSADLGNHEYDVQDGIKEVLPKVKYNILSSNIKINPRNPLSGQVKSSVIKEKNGNKYGIIGATPIDLYKRSKLGMVQRDIYVDDAQQTLKNIQYEADRLADQGVNKIILLSHLGNFLDKLVAQNSRHIDVIQGGHTHDLIFDVKEGENLFYNKDGEPVVITQAGRDGNNFGILNLEFDKNGIIKKVQNNIGYTNKFGRNLPVKYYFDKMFGNNKVWGTVAFAPPPPKSLLVGTNPHAYFVADCIKEVLDADIALVQSANLRGYFEQGDVDTRTIADILPFGNKLWRVNYSEKDIVDAIKYSSKSLVNEANKPGLLYASGLRYSICPEGELISLSFVDKNGKETPIDVRNPRTDRFYSTIVNDYCAQGNDNFDMLCCPDKIVEKYDFDAAVCVEKYLENSKKPVNIADDGRLELIPSIYS